MTRKMALLAGLLGCITPTMLYAQEAAKPTQAPRQSAQQTPADADIDTEVEGIVVTGQRQYGAVLGDIQPETTFSAADVRSLGVSSVTELLSELSAQTASAGGGAPVTLLNGRRISGMGEIRDIPTEAIQRVEILPEEVALKYGYSADQKVVNVVLRQRFRARTGEISVAAPTAGGQTTEQFDSSTLRLNREGRLNTAFKYAHSDKLLESDRDIISRSASSDYEGDVTSYRTLKPRTDSLSFNTVYNRVLENGISATINGSLSYDQSQSLSGLARAELDIPAASPFSLSGQDETVYRYLTDLGAMEQWSRSYNAHGGFTLDGSMKSWRWNLTGNYDHDESRTSTDRNPSVATLQGWLDALDPTFDPRAGLPTGSFIKDRASSSNDTVNTQLVMNGALTRLPAGDISTSIKLGAEGAWVDSWSRRSGVETDVDLSRGTANAQVSFDVPITSRKNNFGAKFGDLSTNLNLAVNQLSDFGTLTSVGYGLNWSPIKPVSFIVSMNNQENAPSMSQLGGAQVTTPDVQVFDYVRGESVQIIRLSGGNPDLKAEEKNTLRVGITLKPPVVDGLSINANYTRTRTDNPISSFPSATAATEAAFPDRFFREDPTVDDPVGRLIRIDARPVNFARRETEQFRWGINLNRQIGKTPPRPTPTPEEMQRWRDRQGQGQGQGQGEGRRGQDGQAAASGQQAQTTQAQGQTQGQVTEGTQPPGMELLQGAMRQGGDQQRAGGDNAQPPSDGPRPGGDQGGPGGGFGGPGGPGGFGGRGPGGGFGGPPPGFGAARLQLALFHTVRLRDRIYITDGGTPLDLLDGDALGNSGGSPRHEIEAQAGLTKNGMGARLTASWKSSTEVTGGTTGSSTGTLKFSDLTTVNLRLFANLGARRELVAKYPVLRGTRVTFGVTNLFDEKQQVRNAAGGTPITYQEDYLDPLGRSVKLSVRKVFF
jgi:iron complex outermembrane receptor protein